jgi:hypothetical protein
MEDVVQLGGIRRAFQIFDDVGFHAPVAEKFQGLSRFAAAGVVVVSDRHGLVSCVG